MKNELFSASKIQKHGNMNANTRTIGLLHACHYGDLDTVKHYIERGAYIDQRYTEDEITPLGEACRSGHFEIVKYLVNQGATVALSKGPPVRWAARYDHTEIVKYLINRGGLLANIIHHHFGLYPQPNVKKYLYKLVMDERKKYLLISLLSTDRSIHRDLLSLIVSKTIKYKRFYYFCELLICTNF